MCECDACNPSAPTTAGDAGIPRRTVVLGGILAFLSACTPRWNQGDRSAPRPPTTAARPPVSQAPLEPITPAQPPRAPIDELPGDGYTIVPRKAWAKLPIKGNNNPMGTVSRISVHHTGEHGHWADLPDVDVVRQIEQYHRNERGWACIGYHFIVGRDGRVYEGRPAKFQGAHVSTQNENNLGISVIGDFDKAPPSRRQLAALKALLDDKRQQYRVPARRVYGHRELHASECPGDALMGWIRKYRSAP